MAPWMTMFFYKQEVFHFLVSACNLSVSWSNVPGLHMALNSQLDTLNQPLVCY